jgi:hypothetical protein
VPALGGGLNLTCQASSNERCHRWHWTFLRALSAPRTASCVTVRSRDKNKIATPPPVTDMILSPQHTMPKSCNRPRDGRNRQGIRIHIPGTAAFYFWLQVQPSWHRTQTQHDTRTPHEGDETASRWATTEPAINIGNARRRRTRNHGNPVEHASENPRTGTSRSLPPEPPWLHRVTLRGG